VEDEKGRHAFIGLGYAERSDAFDLSATLQDFQKQLDHEKEAEKRAKEYEEKPRVDYSLRDGQQITVNLPARSKRNGPSSVATAGAPGGILLPPPPAASRGNDRRVRPSDPQTQMSAGTNSIPLPTAPVGSVFPTPSSFQGAVSQKSASEDLWGDFMGAPTTTGSLNSQLSNPASSSSTATTPSSQKADPFSGLHW